MEYLILKPIEYEESLPIWSVIKITDGLCKLDNWWSIPVQWLCEHWYLKEIQKEPAQAPEWFKAFSAECYDLEDTGATTDECFAEEYEVFLKHYPKQDTESVSVEDYKKDIRVTFYPASKEWDYNCRIVSLHYKWKIYILDSFAYRESPKKEELPVEEIVQKMQATFVKTYTKPAVDRGRLRLDFKDI